MNSFSQVHAKPCMLLFAIIIWINAGSVFSQSYNDVSLKKSSSQATAAVGDHIIYTIQVFNEGKTSLTGLSVLDTLPTGAVYFSHSAAPGTSYDPATGIWDIGNSMTATVDILQLQLEIIITGEGVIYNSAQVWTMNEYDVDSAPANDFNLEDDYDAASVTVPISICSSLNESVTMTAPSGYTDYEWFRNTGSGPVLAGTGIEFTTSLPGEYTFSALSNSCPTGMFCPVIIEECHMVNEPPVANFDTTSTPPNTPVVIDVVSNDSDPEGDLDPSSITVIDPPTNGTVAVNPDGSVTYTPNTDFSGIDTFSYQICDGGIPAPVLCDTALVIVTAGDLVFDLALSKTLAPGQPAQVDIGDEIHYLISVTNEGNFIATNVEVTDHIPPGLVLSPNNTGWSLNPAGDPVQILTGPIMPGATQTVEIVMAVLYGASGQTILNIAEVTSAADGNGNSILDIDSTPNNNNSAEDDQGQHILNLIPHDPTGFIYCENSGEIITGGTISVTGPGQVFIVSNGSSGQYEFYTDGTPGTYQLFYNPPSGYVPSVNCMAQTGSLDPTGMSNPLVLGSDTLAGWLADYSCDANPFWLSFELEQGDPFIFNNNIPLICPESIVPQDTVVINTNCDLSDPLYCFNVPYDQLSNYQFELDGSPFAAEFGPCSLVRDRYYTYVSVLGFGTTGPYRLEYWNVNGVVHNADFQDINELVELMNQWDENGNWTHNEFTRTFAGGDPHSFYGKMIIRHLTTGSVAVLDLYELYSINSSYVIVPAGEHTFVITNISTGATDTVYLRVNCLSPDYVEITQPVGASDTICLSTDELQGNVTAIFNPCLEGFSNASDLNLIPGTNCVEAFGMFPGQTNACYVICDDLGICDTTYIQVTVYEGELNLLPDSLCTPKDVAITGDILNNDEIPTDVVSLTILTEPQHGSVVINADNTVTYVPDEGYCNDDPNEPLDQFTYQVCTAVECQSTTVFVQVKCNGLIVYTGFSPNGDGVNDYFKIDGLAAYPDHKIMVFNRWGNRVFESKNYRNDWNGWWFDKKLPAGTYFYLIDLGDGSDWLSGYLQIIW